MDTSNPGPLLMLGGGILMFVGSLLSWRPDTSGVSTDAFGLLGILTLLFGLLIAGLGGIKAFATGVEIPSEVLGISMDKVAVILSVSIFLWAFGAIAANFIEFGVHLTWIGAAIATVGGVLASRADAAAPATSI